MKNTCQTTTLRKKGMEPDKVFVRRVAIIGLGGLGSTMAEQLVRMGFFNLVLVEPDLVDASNLSRQAFVQTDVGQPKGEALSRHLKQINPDVNVEWHDFWLTDENVSILSDVELIMDATDNLTTRYAINRFAYQHGIPWIYGSALQTRSAYAAFVPGQTPCFECVYGPLSSETEISCSVEGVLLPALMHTVSQQIVLALRVLSGKKMSAVMHRSDIWEESDETFDFSLLVDPDCGSCNPLSKIELPSHLSMKCNGSAIDVWTSHTSSVMPLFVSRYQVTKQNGCFTEFTYKKKRILVFPDKKITFHFHSQQEIIDLLQSQ